MATRIDGPGRTPSRGWSTATRLHTPTPSLAAHKRRPCKLFPTHKGRPPRATCLASSGVNPSTLFGGHTTKTATEGVQGYTVPKHHVAQAGAGATGTKQTRV
eukprot:TRINITY_DN19647_c0_g1_i1.p6 TRINITY_DN19647_c0_g1~~TRINITY_DN19647_c0_g1_i1.p6  ORF type:complete len:102 (-),score=1.74 TRINITY_DN19647_c0_g1_i1:65-370(-)